MERWKTRTSNSYPETVKHGDLVDIKVIVGEEIAHPNTFEHYISWIKVYFQPEGHKFPIEIGSCNFTSHGESGLLTEPNVSLRFKAKKMWYNYMRSSYCNIHGLWENSVELKVEE